MTLWLALTVGLLVRSIVGLAHNLGMSVVAEGVETIVQRERLIAFGCEFGQGMHFSPPVDAAAATAMVRRGVPTIG